MGKFDKIIITHQLHQNQQVISNTNVRSTVENF